MSKNNRIELCTEHMEKTMELYKKRSFKCKDLTDKPCKDFCRICLKLNDGTFVSLGQKVHLKWNFTIQHLNEILRKATGIRLSDKHGLCTMICGECANKILDFYSLTRQIGYSNSLLIDKYHSKAAAASNATENKAIAPTETPQNAKLSDALHAAMSETANSIKRATAGRQNWQSYMVHVPNKQRAPLLNGDNASVTVSEQQQQPTNQTLSAQEMPSCSKFANKVMHDKLVTYLPKYYDNKIVQPPQSTNAPAMATTSASVTPPPALQKNGRHSSSTTKPATNNNQKETENGMMGPKHCQKL